MAKITFTSLNKRGILQNLVVAIILMAIIPLLLTIYIFHTEAADLLQKNNVQIIILLMIASACCGYILSRKTVISIIKLLKEVESITQEDLKKRIKTQEENEVNKLAQYFNHITDELQKNIEDLKKSKIVLQNVLLRIGNAMASSEKIESILELTIETLTNALNAESGAIMLLKKEKLHIMVCYGIEPRRHKSIEIKEGTGITGWVAKEKKSQNITRAQQDRRFDIEVKMGLAHKSIICVPLIFKDRILGVISIHDKIRSAEFTKEDLVLLENLAAQAAIAIENNRLNKDIERTYIETISALALAVEAKDPYSYGHAKRVSAYVTKLAKEFALDTETTSMLQDAALLHDIGKIGIRDEILLKKASLTAEEKRQMQQHAIIGENILLPISSLGKVAHLVRHHQEQENGKGYPDGLTGTEMSLALKILIVSDAYDAMTSDRSYRKAMTRQQAKKELLKYSGIYFNPKVVQTFIEII